MAQKNSRERTVKRAPASRSARNRILIVVEGRRTEKNYFRDLRKTERLSAVRVEVISSEKTNPTGIVTHAESLIKNGTNRFDPKSFEFVYIVFDHDGRELEFRNAITLTNQLNDKGYRTEFKERIQFVAIPSNPNFELWFLLHFVRIFPHEMSSADVLKQLMKYWPEYQKNAEGTYQATKTHLEEAKSNAVLLRETPGRTSKEAVTNVDLLITELTQDI